MTETPKHLADPGDTIPPIALDPTTPVEQETSGRAYYDVAPGSTILDESKYTASELAFIRARINAKPVMKTSVEITPAPEMIDAPDERRISFYKTFKSPQIIAQEKARKYIEQQEQTEGTLEHAAKIHREEEEEEEAKEGTSEHAAKEERERLEKLRIEQLERIVGTPEHGKKQKLLNAKRSEAGNFLKKGSKERLDAVTKEASRVLFGLRPSNPGYHQVHRTTVHADDGKFYTLANRYNSDTNTYSQVADPAPMLRPNWTASLMPQSRKELKAVKHIKHARHKFDDANKKMNDITTPYRNHLDAKRLQIDPNLPQFTKEGNKTREGTDGAISYNSLSFNSKMNVLINKPGRRKREKRSDRKALANFEKNQKISDKWFVIGAVQHGHHKEKLKPWTWKNHNHGHGTSHDREEHDVHTAPSHEPRLPKVRRAAVKVAQTPRKMVRRAQKAAVKTGNFADRHTVTTRNRILESRMEGLQSKAGQLKSEAELHMSGFYGDGNDRFYVSETPMTEEDQNSGLRPNPTIEEFDKLQNLGQKKTDKARLTREKAERIRSKLVRRGWSFSPYIEPVTSTRSPVVASIRHPRP